ncbi:MAG: GNAT family N-acetyltransferase, partial [Caulobacteraceae bacterium]
MIETERLRLLPWSEAEREPLFRMTADPEVMVDYGAPFTPAEAEARFERCAETVARDGFGKWALRRKQDGAFVGMCGVS